MTDLILKNNKKGINLLNIDENYFSFESCVEILDKYINAFPKFI